MYRHYLSKYTNIIDNIQDVILDFLIYLVSCEFGCVLESAKMGFYKEVKAQKSVQMSYGTWRRALTHQRLPPDNFYRITRYTEVLPFR